MKARTGARGEFELVRGPNAERELLDVGLRSLFEATANSSSDEK